MTELQVGDRVELVRIPLGRTKRLRVGMVGEVVVGSEGTEFGWGSVLFGKAGYPFLLAPRHLHLIERAPAAADDAEDDDA
jgi:hypothetical protein